MDGNLDLTGVITVQEYGILNLQQDVAAADAFTKGGIVGGACSSIIVSSGGSMARGFSNGTGGSVLVDVPVEIAGTFELYKAGSQSLKNVIKFGTAFEGGDNHGYAVALTADSSLFIQDRSTDVIAEGGVLVSGSDATYQVTVDGSGQSLTGNLIFTNGGFLKLLNATSATGTFDVDGDLTLSVTTETYMNWNTTDADLISVSGTATLAGWLKMSGVGPPQNTNRRVFFSFSYDVVGTFNALGWPGGSGNLSQTNNGNGLDIKWN